MNFLKNGTETYRFCDRNVVGEHRGRLKRFFLRQFGFKIAIDRFSDGVAGPNPGPILRIVDVEALFSRAIYFSSWAYQARLIQQPSNKMRLSRPQDSVTRCRTGLVMFPYLQHDLLVGLLVAMLFCAGCQSDTEPSEQPDTSESSTAADSSAPGESQPEGNDTDQTDEPEIEYEPFEEDDSPVFVEPGFAPLTLADFDFFQAEEGTWSEEGATIRCSGKPRGYAYTNKEFESFTLRVDYRFPRPVGLQDDETYAGNTGFMIYITGEHKLWPVSLEVQGKYFEMGMIKANGGAATVVGSDDEGTRRSTRQPVGQWNSIEIVSRDGQLTASINGTTVAESEPSELKRGAFGLQSEDFPVHFRNLRIRED